MQGFSTLYQATNTKISFTRRLNFCACNCKSSESTNSSEGPNKHTDTNVNRKCSKELLVLSFSLQSTQLVSCAHSSPSFFAISELIPPFFSNKATKRRRQQHDQKQGLGIRPLPQTDRAYYATLAMTRFPRASHNMMQKLMSLELETATQVSTAASNRSSSSLSSTKHYQTISPWTDSPHNTEKVRFQGHQQKKKKNFFFSPFFGFCNERSQLEEQNWWSSRCNLCDRGIQIWRKGGKNRQRVCT